MPLARSKTANDAKAATKAAAKAAKAARRTRSRWAGWNWLRTQLGHVLAALAAIWRWLGPPRTQTLLPYVRPRRISRLARMALALLTIAFCFIYGFGFGLFAPVLIALFVIPLVAMALLVIWALPEARRAPTVALERLFVAFVLAMLLWPNYLAVAIPGLPQLTFLRIIGVPMAICLMVCVSVSQAFRQQLSASLKNSPLLWRTILTFFCIQTLSIGFSASIAGSMNIYFNMLLSWYSVFFISCYCFSHKGTAQQFTFVIWGTAVALGLLAIWENYLQAVPWQGHIPGFLRIENPVVEKVLAGSSRGFGKGHRAQGPFTTGIAMAEYLALAVPFLLHFVAGRFRPWVRVAAGASVALAVYGILLCQARTGLLGTLIALLVFPLAVALLYARRHRNSIVASLMFYCSPLVAVVGLGVALAVPAIRIRLLGGGTEQMSTDARYEQWHLGMPKIIAHPWGWGLGRGAETVGYTTPEGFLSIDSYVLRLVVEYGIVGIIVYYAYALFALFYVAKNTWDADEDHNRATLFIACGTAVLSFTAMQINFAQEDNQAVMFIVYGMIVGLRFTDRKPRLAEARPDARQLARVARPR